jgi:hypothetical protein
LLDRLTGLEEISLARAGRAAPDFRSASSALPTFRPATSVRRFLGVIALYIGA